MNKDDDLSAGARQDSMQAIIEKAKRELEHMMDLNPQVMLLVNAEGIVIRTNRALLDCLGLESYGDALNTPLHYLFDCENPEFISNQLKTPGSGFGQSAVALRDGRRRMLSFKVIASGADLGLRMVIVTDVTDLQAESVHLEKAHKKQAVEALMGALMHNINQPLTVIMVTARLMHLAIEQGTWNEDEMKTNLQEITDQTMSVSRLLEQVQGARDFVTETYLEGMDIMDIKKSAGEQPGEATTDR